MTITQHPQDLSSTSTRHAPDQSPTVQTHPTDPMGRTRVFTGLKPTGALQIGNYLGAIRPLLALTADPSNEVTVSVVDLHALTVEHDPTVLRERTLEMAATLLACGLDTRPETGTRLFAQSTVPAHTELHYLLESTATYGEMHRMVQFKEKSGIGDPFEANPAIKPTATGRTGEARRQASVRLSLLTYPALMAADILVHQAAMVPVGADQKQHLELARNLAGRFNARYGDVFTVPEGVTATAGARIKDLRTPTAKMGKSGDAGDGVLHLLDSPDVLAAKVRRATTDSDPVLGYDPLARPGVTNLAILLGALTDTDPRTVLDGIHGSGALKVAVADALVETLTPIQSRYAEIRADEAYLRQVLREGAEAARPCAHATVAAAREAMGLIAV